MRPSGLSRPDEVCVIAGGVCNVGCLFCHERSETDGDFPARALYRKAQGSFFMEAELLRSRLAELEGPPEQLLFEGGEPTLHPRLTDLIVAAREAGVARVGVITNGVRLERANLLERLISAGMNTVVFSIHGSKPSIHDRLTQSPRSLELLLSSLKRCAALGLRTITHTVLNKINASDVPELLELLTAVPGVRPIWLSTLYLNGLARRNVDDLFAPLSELARGVDEGLRRLPPEAREKVSVTGLPACLLPDFAERVQRYRTIASLGPDGFVQGGATGMQGPPCSSCEARRGCDGVWKEYADRAGWGELRPFRSSRRAAGLRTTLLALAPEKDLRDVPWGLGCLKSAAEAGLPPEKAGEIRIVEAWAGESPAALAEKVLEGRPGLVVLATGPSIGSAEARLAAAIKRAAPRAAVLLLEGEGIPRRKGLAGAGSMDGALLSDGRAAFQRVVDRLAAGKGWRGVEGVAVRRPGRWALRAAPAAAGDSPSPYLDGTLRATAGCRLELKTEAGEAAAERLAGEIELLGAQAQSVTCRVHGDASAAPDAVWRLIRESSDRRLWNWLLASPLESWSSRELEALDSRRVTIVAQIGGPGFAFDRARAAGRLTDLRSRLREAELKLELTMDLEGSYREAIDWALSTGLGWWSREPKRSFDVPSDDPDIESRRFTAYSIGGALEDVQLRRALQALGRGSARPLAWLELAEGWIERWETLGGAGAPRAQFESESGTLRWGGALSMWPAAGGVSARLEPRARSELLASAARQLRTHAS